MRSVDSFGRTSPTARGYGGTGTLVVWRDDAGQERTRTWPNALPGHRSPCRVDASKGLRQHRCSTAHRALVDGYRSWAESARLAAEAVTHGYEAELAEYWQAHERPTFRAYLLAMAQPDTDRADVA